MAKLSIAHRKPFKEGCRLCGSSNLKSRGLCEKHYRRFRAKVEAFENVDDAEEFERQCIEDGWLLPKQTGGRPKEQDAFDIIAEKIIAEGHAEIDAALKDYQKKKAAKKVASPKNRSVKRRR